MIDVAELNRIVKDCLPETPHPTPTVGRGIVCDFAFDPERLPRHRPAVVAMLKQLSPEFFTTGGAGISTLRMCVLADGAQWGEQPDVQSLCALGHALGLVEYSLPRQIWSALPGGMPYVTVRDDRFEDAPHAQTT